VTANGKATREVALQDGSSEEREFLPDHVTCVKKTVKKSTRTFMPGVVEPSFGIDRILFATLEHAYYARPKDESEGDKQTRGVLSLSPAIAPYKLTILPLDQRISNSDFYATILQQIRASVSVLGHSSTVDDSGATVGKRYSRNDELGIPFACTVDFESKDDRKVTLRERDSMEQIRIPADRVPVLVHEICCGRRSWEDALKEFPRQTTK